MKNFILPILYLVYSLCLTSCGEIINTKKSAEKVIVEKKVISSVNRSSEYEKSILELVNQYRTKLGLVALENNSDISEIARNHSMNMAKGLSQWGHEGYEERSKMVGSIIRWEECGENLARVLDDNPPIQAMAAWVNSPLHEDNLVGDFNVTGIGIYRSNTGEYFITQIFVRV